MFRSYTRGSYRNLLTYRHDMWLIEPNVKGILLQLITGYI
jgi:hypothetical protein